jgi:hypothetical protein
MLLLLLSVSSMTYVTSVRWAKSQVVEEAGGPAQCRRNLAWEQQAHAPVNPKAQTAPHVAP